MSTLSLIKAIDFAARKHSDQRRKNQTASPYINHPIDVMNILAQHIPRAQTFHYQANEIGTTVDPIDPIFANTLFTTAVLHDTLEDTKTNYDELKTEFGVEIADAVLECSDDKSLDQVTRKQMQIQHAESLSLIACLVKLADKISNCTSLIDDGPPLGWSKKRTIGYTVWSFHVASALSKRLQVIQNLSLTPYKSLIDHAHSVFQRAQHLWSDDDDSQKVSTFYSQDALVQYYKDLKDS